MALHGDMTSLQLEALQKFKDEDVPLLIASDVAAYELDIAGLSHVLNFDVPMSAEDYVHRIGELAGLVNQAAHSQLPPARMILNMSLIEKVGKSNYIELDQTSVVNAYQVRHQMMTANEKAKQNNAKPASPKKQPPQPQKPKPR